MLADKAKLHHLSLLIWKKFAKLKQQSQTARVRSKSSMLLKSSVKLPLPNPPALKPLTILEAETTKGTESACKLTLMNVSLI